MGIKTWWRSRKARKLASQADLRDIERRELVVIRVTGSDGWTPIADFVGSDLEATYTAAVWVYAALSANVEAMAQLEPAIQRRGKSEEGQWVDDPEAAPPAMRLAVESPMGSVPVPWSWRDWIRHVALQLYLHGAAYVDTRGDRLYLLRSPGAVEIEWDQSGWPVQYRYGSEVYSPDEIIHLGFTKPGTYAGGTSPLQAVRGLLDVGAQAQRRLEWHLANRAAPGMIFKIPGSYLRSEARAEFLQYLVENYQDASKTGTPLIVSDDVQVDAKGTEGYEKQTRELFDADRLTRDGILAAFRTPPMILGVYDNAPIQQYRTAILSWWQTALFPVLSSILDQINAQWVWPRFGRGIRIWYSLTGSQIGLELLKERISVAKGLTDLGYPANMAAAKAGLDMPHVPDLDVANVPWVTAGRVDPESSA